MKIFEDYLNEVTSKQIEVPGWKKSTKAKLIKELTNKKSLYVSTWGPQGEDGEYILDVMKSSFTDSKLSSVFSHLKSQNQWRTVKKASQTTVLFFPEGRVDFNQVGDKWFYEKKLFDGTVFLFYTRNYNKDWDEWSHLFIFYYVPDNVNEEWLDEKSGWDSEHPKYILQFNVGVNVYYKKKTSKNFSFTKLDWDINDYITDNIKEADIQDTPDKFKALKKELEVKYPKVIMYLFPDKKVRLSVTTYYMFKEEQESLYKNEQEMFVINEDTSLLAKVFGKKKLQDDLMWDLAKRDIDAHRSTYEEIKAPYSKDKFKPYEYILVRYKDGNTGVFNTGKDEGTRFAYYVSDFRDIDVAVGIKKVAYSKISSERTLKYINTTNKINDDIIRKYRINMVKFKNNKELFKLEKIAEKYDCVVSSAVWLSPKDEFNDQGKQFLHIYISRNDYEKKEDIYAVRKYDNEPWEGLYNYGRSETTNITGDWKKMINEIESKIDYTKLPQFHSEIFKYKNVHHDIDKPTFDAHYARPYYRYDDRIG